MALRFLPETCRKVGRKYLIPNTKLTQNFILLICNQGTILHMAQIWQQ